MGWLERMKASYEKMDNNPPSWSGQFSFAAVYGDRPITVTANKTACMDYGEVEALKRIVRIALLDGVKIRSADVGDATPTIELTYDCGDK